MHFYAIIRYLDRANVLWYNKRDTSSTLNHLHLFNSNSISHYLTYFATLWAKRAKFLWSILARNINFAIFLERKIDWWHFTSPLLLLCKGSESQILIRTFFKGLCRHQRKWKHSWISGMHSPMEGGQHLLLFGPHQSAPREPLRLWGQVQVLCLFHHPPGIDPLL